MALAFVRRLFGHHRSRATVTPPCTSAAPFSCTLRRPRSPPWLTEVVAPAPKGLPALIVYVEP